MNKAISSFVSSSASLALVALLAASSTAACGTSDASPFANAGSSSSSGGGGGSGSGGGSGGSTGSSGSSGGGTSSGSGGSSGGVASGDAGTSSGGGGDAGGPGCGVKPARYIVIGHSVAACFDVGGTMSEQCASKSVETYMAMKFPGLTYENYAVDGALIADVVNNQLPMIMGGAGPVFVNVFIGGNDLAAHLYEPDATATQSWMSLEPGAMQNMNTIVSYFEDKSKFPGGAVVMINSQYNPFDECVTSAYSYASMVKQNIIKEFNADLLTKIVGAHKSAVYVENYGDVLGHGDNYNQAMSTTGMACPHYMAGAATWMADLIHPNALGHAQLAKEMTAAVDLAYSCP